MASVAKLKTSASAESGTVHWLNDCIARAASSVVMEVATISPGLASVILEHRNEHNRPMKWKVEHYAADMRAGRWQFNGEPILFSADGQLNDGQNRLQAIIDANLSQPLVCIFGLARDSRMSVDQGAARSAGDYLGMGGSKNAHNVASIAKGVLAYERGEGQRLASHDITNAEVVARAKTDPMIDEACDYAVSVYPRTRAFAAPKIIGAAFYLLNDVDAEDAKAYMDAVSLGEGLRRSDPAYAVREALISQGKGHLQSKMEIIFRGWVAFRQGRPLKMAKVLGTFPALI